MTPGRRRWMIGTVIAVLTAVLLYCFPLFRVVPLRQEDAARPASRPAGQPAGIATFEPVAFVDQFWTDRLIPGAAGAVNVADLVAAIQQDPKVAKKTHGRSMALGSTYYYFVAGTGRVVSVEKNAIGLAIEDGSTQIQVTLETGNIFGNAVRDGTCLLDVNNFANSQDFNSVSSELNIRIEKEVLPILREKATVGATIRFVGCAEIIDEGTDLHPLHVVPFIVETP